MNAFWLLAVLIPLFTSGGGRGVASAVPPLEGFFAAKSGSALNPGTELAPWTPSYALAGGGELLSPSAETLWVRGGVYRGDRLFALQGLAQGSEVMIRAYPGERVIFDGSFSTIGSFSKIWGVELCLTSSDRIALVPGSDPTDLPGRYHKSAEVLFPGTHNKWICCSLRGYANGAGDSPTVVGTEWTGCIIYNPGWHGDDRGHGHLLYLQNDGPDVKLIQNCVFFTSYATGLKLAGSSASKIRFITVRRSAVFGAGTADELFGAQFNLNIDGGSDYYPLGLGFLTLEYNHFFQVTSPGVHSLGMMLHLDEPTTPGDTLIFEHNIVQDVQPEFNCWINSRWKYNKLTTGSYSLIGGKKLFMTRLATGSLFSTNDIDFNEMYTPGGVAFHARDGSGTTFNPTSLAGWRTDTGYDLNSTLTIGQPTGSDIRVEGIPYNPGRAHITCWNWDLALNLEIPVIDAVHGGLSDILSIGDKYVIHHVYDLLGPPVASGTYGGGAISLPQFGYTPPKPDGSSFTPPGTGGKFNVFLLRKVTQTSVPAAPTDLAAVPAGGFAIDLTWVSQSSNEKGFVLERKQAWDSDGPAGFDWVPHEIFPAGTSSGQAVDLTSDTLYEFRLRSYNEAGQSAQTASASATTDFTATVFLSAAFGVAGGTLLQDYTPETGMAFVKHPTQTGNFQITADGRIRPSSSTLARYYSPSVPTNADYDFEWDFYIASSGVPDRPRGCVRMDPVNADFIAGQIYSGGAFLYRVVGGVYTFLNQYTTTWVLASSHHAKLQVRGDSIEFWIDDVLRVSGSAGEVTAVGHCGLEISNHASVGDAIGIHFDNLVATNS